MSGVNRSLATSHFMGTRAGSGETNAQGVSLGLPVTYIPARIEAGVAKPAKASFTVFHNTGWTPANGEKAAGERYTMWGYGRKAEQFAKWLSPGRAVDLVTARHSFDGNHYIAGQILLDNTGQPIIIRRSADIIQQFLLREEAAKWINNEVQMGRRPINWQNPAHPDFEVWRKVLMSRSAMVWDCQSQTYGFARVSMPQGIQINVAYYQQLREELAKRYGNLVGQQPVQGAAPAAVPNYAPAQPAMPAPVNPVPGVVTYAQAPVNPAVGAVDPNAAWAPPVIAPVNPAAAAGPAPAYTAPPALVPNGQAAPVAGAVDPNLAYAVPAPVYPAASAPAGAPKRF